MGLLCYTNVMGKWIHKLSEIDAESKRAVCAECGPVDIIWKNPRWKCKIARKLDRGKEHKRDYAEHPYRQDRDPLLAAQGPNCKLCLKVMDKPVYDHDHLTGKFRGYICHNCNVGLGMFKDDVDVLRLAIKYLEN